MHPSESENCSFDFFMHAALMHVKWLVPNAKLLVLNAIWLHGSCAAWTSANDLLGAPDIYNTNGTNSISVAHLSSTDLIVCYETKWGSTGFENRAGRCKYVNVSSQSQGDPVVLHGDLTPAISVARLSTTSEAASRISSDHCCRSQRAPPLLQVGTGLLCNRPPG